jgi:hypothetical protein
MQSVDLGHGSEHPTSSFPSRLFLPHLEAGGWRSYGGLNAWVTRAAFPALAIETSEDWADRAAFSTPLALERVVLEDRSAAMRSPLWQASHRIAAGPMTLGANWTGWWAPIRDRIVDAAITTVEGSAPAAGPPVITYISRQAWGRRMLRPQDHSVLVEELQRLRAEFGYEVHVVDMDQLPIPEQLALAGRTTVRMSRCEAPFLISERSTLAYSRL